MRAYELAQKLLDGEDIEVMFQDPNSHDGPFSVNDTQLETVGESEFPEDFDMPEGFTYILLIN